MTWLPGPTVAPLDPEGARRALAWVTSDEGPAEPVAHRAVYALLAPLAPGADARIGALTRLASDVNGSPVAPGLRIGLPPRLADALLRRAGKTPTVARTWIGDRRAEGLPHDGVTGEGTEWWGDPRGPGATYADRLCAWGTVDADVLPRAAWRWDGAFVPTDALRAVATAMHVARGPGHLLAAVADAVRTMAADLSQRDAAALWGGWFLPLLAPTLRVAGPPGDPLDVPPEYAVQLAFHVLHPRARAAVVVLDRLATWADSGDLAALGAVLGEPVADPAAAVRRLLAPVARTALARHAAVDWDAGLGFRLLRRVLRALGDAADPAAAIDAELHPNLADRLREAFGTALAAADPSTPGAATSQLVDLVLIRWADPDFLAEVQVPREVVT